MKRKLKKTVAKMGGTIGVCECGGLIQFWSIKAPGNRILKGWSCEACEKKYSLKEVKEYKSHSD